MRVRPKLQWVRANAGYPALSPRKKLVAHLLLARAQAGHLLSVDENSISWEKALRKTAGTAAGYYKRTDYDQVPLSSHIDAVLEAFESEAPPVTEAKALRLFKIEHDRLRGDAGIINCNVCAGKRQVCDGINDAANMTARPLCWKRVDEMVDYAVKTAQSAYSRLFPASQDEVPVQITVSVLTAGSAGLDGSVTFPVGDSATSRSAEVTLYLPETIGRDEYLRSLYALFHEIFVHSVQALGVSGTRPVFDELCQFTEGFVDRAAAMALHEALLSDPPPRFENAYLRARFASETRRGNWKRTEAYGAEDPHACRIAEHRLEGRELFDQIQALVNDNMRVAINVAMHLNLQLGAKEARIEIHDRLTWLTHTASSTRRRKARLSLEQFAADGEWATLANALGFKASPNP
jgi:hypothetical protein